jgi:competence protein ComEA
VLAGCIAPARAEPVARAPAATVTRASAAAPPSSRGAVDVVNLNDASEEQLMLLPGIGPGKARSIIEHRHVHPFRRVDELTKVKGIGRKTFGRLRPYLTIAGATTLQKEVKFLRR